MPISITLVASNAAGSTVGSADPIAVLTGYGQDQETANCAAAADFLRELADKVEFGTVPFSDLASISITYDAG